MRSTQSGSPPQEQWMKSGCYPEQNFASTLTVVQSILPVSCCTAHSAHSAMRLAKSSCEKWLEVGANVPLELIPCLGSFCKKERCQAEGFPQQNVHNLSLTQSWMPKPETYPASDSTTVRMRVQQSLTQLGPGTEHRVGTGVVLRRCVGPSIPRRVGGGGRCPGSRCGCCCVCCCCSLGATGRSKLGLLFRASSPVPGGRRASRDGPISWCHIVPGARSVDRGWRSRRLDFLGRPTDLPGGSCAHDTCEGVCASRGGR